MFQGHGLKMSHLEFCLQFIPSLSLQCKTYINSESLFWTISYVHISLLHFTKQPLSKNLKRLYENSEAGKKKVYINFLKSKGNGYLIGSTYLFVNLEYQCHSFFAKDCVILMQSCVICTLQKNLLLKKKTDLETI